MKPISNIDFINTFTEEYSHQYLLSIKYPDGHVFCTNCGHNKVFVCKSRSKRKELSSIPSFKCSACSKKFSTISETLFEGSKIPLHKWMYLVYMNSNIKKNISSVQLSKNIGITQKSTWHAQSKIREIMFQDNLKLSGTIEVDEAFVSKGNKWTRWGGISTRKEPILGLIQRGGPVVLLTIPDRTKESIIPIIQKYCQEGSTIYTDGYYGYKNLIGFSHDFVQHNTREYVRGKVHTNNIENIWSQLKKSIRNAHHQISAKHIQQYLNEAAFRFNHRHLSQQQRFDMLINRAVNKWQNPN